MRGAAVLLVVLFHAFPAWLPGGFIGVDVFFVLSGYLTTAGLLRERAETGRMAVGAFFWRRALRLEPALGLLVLADMSYAAIAHDALDTALVDGALVLAGVANWSLALGFERPGLLAHCWTVSLEEQFYLLAPPLARALGRRGRLAGLLVLGAVVALAVWRLILARHGSAPLRLFNGLDTRLGALLIGALLAGLQHHSGTAWNLLTGAARGLAPPAAALLLGAALVLDWTAVSTQPGWFEAIAVGAALVIVAAAAPRTGALQRILTVRGLRRLGAISYGLFLWHFPLIWIVAGNPVHASMGQILLALGLSLGAALASAALVERPLLAWGRRALAPLVATPIAVATR